MGKQLSVTNTGRPKKCNQLTEKNQNAQFTFSIAKSL